MSKNGSNEEGKSWHFTVTERDISQDEIKTSNFFDIKVYEFRGVNFVKINREFRPKRVLRNLVWASMNRFPKLYRLRFIMTILQKIAEIFKNGKDK